MTFTLLLKRLFDFFVFSSLFIACCAVLMVWQTSFLFHFPFSWKLAGFVFGGTVCSYNFHWYLTPPAITSPSQKIRWNLSHKNLHLLLSGIGLIIAICFGFFLIRHWLWLGLTGIVTFLYSAPKIDHPFFFHLRKIAIGKTIYLALVWTIITAGLPIAIADNGPDEWILLFIVNRFFFIYAICILFDYRDREMDIQAGIRSLITFFNEKGVHLLFWSSLFIAVVTQVWLGVLFSWVDTLAFLLPMVALAFLYSTAKRNFSDYLYYFILDGLMMASAPLLVLAKFAR